MFNIGTPELLVILVIALIVLGPERLPEVGRTIGRALSEFRKVQDEVRDMVRFDLSETPEVDPPVTAPVRSLEAGPRDQIADDEPAITEDVESSPAAGTEIEADDRPDDHPRGTGGAAGSAAG